MKRRRKKKQTAKNARRNWWEEPTFFTYGPSDRALSNGTIRVELILPSGSRVDLGRFPVPKNHDELRKAVGERFKEIWDPEKFCRRAPAT